MTDPWIVIAAIAQSLAAIATFWAVWVALGVRRKKYKIITGKLGVIPTGEFFIYADFVNMGQCPIVITHALLKLSGGKSLFLTDVLPIDLCDPLPKTLNTSDKIRCSIPEAKLKMYLLENTRYGIVGLHEKISFCFTDSAGKDFIKKTKLTVGGICK